MALRLHNTAVLEDNVQLFTFIIEEFSDVGESVFSKPFFFAGHRWRLQGGVRGGHFGAYLRWNGGGALTAKVKCRINFSAGVVNLKDPSQSIYVGHMDEDDEFPRSGFGIGWSKIVNLDELEGEDAGFLNDNCLFFELRCRLVRTTFEDKLVLNLPAGISSVSSSRFSLCGTEWSILLFPKGEPKQGVPPQYDHASVYLKREHPGKVRFKATYSIYLHGGREYKIQSHHFFDECHRDANAFGIEKFIRTRDLKAAVKGGTVSIGVKITSMEPYYYFGLETKDWEPPTELGSPFRLDEYSKTPLSFQACTVDNSKLAFQLQFDPGPDNKHKEVDDSAYYRKILWRVSLFCFKDESKSLELRSWNMLGRSSFCYSQDEMVLPTTLDISEVTNPDSPYLDEEKQLSVRLVIDSANEVYDPLLVECDKHSIAKLREFAAQGKATTEEFWKNQLDDVCTEKDKIINDQEDMLDAREDELEEKEAAIHTLEEEIQENEELLSEVDGSGEGSPRKITSIKEMAKKTETTPEELEKQHEISEKLKKFLLNNVPFNITRVLTVGAAGQGTTISSSKELDLAMFVKDLPRTEHRSWLPAIVYTIKTLLKQHSTHTAEPDTDDKQQGDALPPCTDFVTTPTTVLFMCDDVKVTLIPTNDWEAHGGSAALYQMCLKQPAEAQPFYNIAVCDIQTEFIAKQSDKCKEQIRVVKGWANSVPWKDDESRPGAYLLSLLVAAAHQIVQSSAVSQTSVADKEVFQEFAEITNDEQLEVFWNEYYLSSQYPTELFPVPFELPIIQDPALPTHNVAAGLEDWNQFRKEAKKWVLTLGR